MLNDILKIVTVLVSLFMLAMFSWVYGWGINRSYVTHVLQKKSGDAPAIILTRTSVAPPERTGTLTVTLDGDIHLDGLFLESRRAKRGHSAATVAGARAKADELALTRLFFVNRTVCLDAYLSKISIAAGPFLKTINSVECPDEKEAIRTYRTYLLETFTEER